MSNCLDIDVMSQGESVRHALDGLIESIQIVLREDAPETHRPAPAEDGELLHVRG